MSGLIKYTSLSLLSYCWLRTFSTQMEPGEKWKSFPWVSFCNPEKFYVIVETRGSVASSSRALSLWKPLHFLFDFFLWGGCPTAYGILVPCPGIEPTPPGLGAWTLNHSPPGRFSIAFPEMSSHLPRTPGSFLLCFFHLLCFPDLSQQGQERCSQGWFCLKCGTL